MSGSTRDAGRRPVRRGVQLAGAGTFVGLVLTATGLSVGGAVAHAAPNGGACGPNNHFGRLVPDNPAAQFNYDDLAPVAKFITESPNHVENVWNIPNTLNLASLSQDESDIDAGYTYFGQFVDHDITLDPRPADLKGDIDPWTLVNNRSPQFDLDSVYGKGPKGSPELYESDGVSLKLGNRLTGSASDPEARDLLRNAKGQAMIGDGRNDENKIVASFHSLMTRFHNKIVRDIKKAKPYASNDQVFAEAQRQVQWYYQWAVLTDFLPTMSSSATVANTVQYNGYNWTTNLKWYDSCRGSIPTEFAVAAYRWHTMVRDDYQVNDQVKDKKIFNGSFAADANLAGGQPTPSNFGFDWDFFLKGGSRTPQEAYKFDNSLVPALGILPPDVAGGGPVNLSERNLFRGNQLRLPSGQDMARSLGIPVLRDDQIIVGPALGVGAKTKALTEFSPTFAGKAPLWAYLAAESVNAKYTVKNGRIVAGDSQRLRLGPTGAAIVNETIVGLMANDPNSVINHPEFKPDGAYEGQKGFTFRDLIRIATNSSSSYPSTATKTTYLTPSTTPNYAYPWASGDNRKTVIASSSDEHNGWGISKMLDNLWLSYEIPSKQSIGYSSTNSPNSDHSEWMIIDDGSVHYMSVLTLVPRTDTGNLGEGFPVDMRVEVSSDGFNWKTVVTKTGIPKPIAAQAYTFPVQKARYVRVTATKLSPNANENGQYAMQFSEIATA